MKKILLAILFSGSLFSGNAQDAKEKVSGLKSFAAIKWNPASLALGKLGAFGEYNFKKKKSITLGVGIPFEKKRTIQLDNKDREFSMKTFSIMGGYRMYLGKKTMTGFYFEPYLKYVKNDAATTMDVTISNNKTLMSFNSNYSGEGVGAQLGLQFCIAKTIVFDLFLLGPEANNSHHTIIMKDLGATTTPWDAQASKDAQKLLQDQVKDVPIVGKKVQIVVDPNAHTVSSDYKGFLPGFRFGGSVGIRF